MGELGFCHYSDIAAAVANQLGVDISVDTGWPFFLIRLLHNKAFDWTFFSLKCYFQYLDTEQIFSFLSPFLLPFIIYAFWPARHALPEATAPLQAGSQGNAGGPKLWRNRIICLILLMPIIFMLLLKSLNIGIKIYAFQGFWILLAIVGCVKMITKKLKVFKLS